jgi:hypothetical protein
MREKNAYRVSVGEPVVLNQTRGKHYALRAINSLVLFGIRKNFASAVEGICYNCLQEG